MNQWQLDMLRFSLKKQQKLRLLDRMLQTLPLTEARCLLVTNGDNTGALNAAFRELGGQWSWAEMESDAVAAMEEFLAEPVAHVRPDALPYGDASFDRIVVIDVHEHLPNPQPFNTELGRLLAPGGLLIVTTPNGDRRLPVAVLKRWIGMDETAYGHVVQGYRVEELEEMMRAVGLHPAGRGSYSKFFTELTELIINFGYVKVLSRRGNGRKVHSGEIAPRTAAQLQAVSRSYRLYRAVFPAVRAFASLDVLVPGRGGYAVSIAARKPA